MYHESFDYFFILLLSVMFRWIVSFGPYSGEAKPPMFGDYEAQRHWMEVTINLPAKQWYRNSTKNDLQYWGLDYPPLTAYHSYAMGWISKQINSSWIELGSSRGLESAEHKFFMRATSLVADLLIFLPALIIYTRSGMRGGANDPGGRMVVHSLALVLHPAFILVDHGHFQYNCVSLGLFLWAVLAITAGRHSLGTGLFCMALNFKQLELYHALPLFCYLLGDALFNKKGGYRISRFFKLAMAVLASFAVLWSPWLYHSYQLGSLRPLLRVLHRLFPFARGLYEDKVANFWCSLSVVVKWKEVLAVGDMVRLCFVTTLLMHLPSGLLLFLRPAKSQLSPALTISALTFFLFSFHVHEKGILLPLLPVLLLVSDVPEVSIWFSLISLISLHPLCAKDELRLAFYSCSLAYYVLCCDCFRLGLFQPTDPLRGPPNKQHPQKASPLRFSFRNFLLHTSFLGGLALCVLSEFLDPPKRYPDLFPAVVSIYCCFWFCCFLVYLNCYQISVFNKLMDSDRKIKSA